MDDLEQWSDAMLVQAAQGGNERAFGALFDRHYESIFRLGFRMHGSRADAEDIAQETFIRAGKGIARFRGRSKFSSWLYRIAINLSFDLHKSKQRQITLAAEYQEQVEPGPENSRQSQILAALAQLTPLQRGAITLTLIEGLSYRETAERMGNTTALVAWHVHAAKRKLKTLLEAGDE